MAEMGGERLPNHTLKDALRRYARDESPKHEGERWEVVRLRALERVHMASVALPSLTATTIAEWRDERLKSVSGGSVARELTLLKSVLEIARREWGWLHKNPALDVAKPATPPSRKRRIAPDEVERVTLACGLSDLEADTAQQRTGLAFLFALETAMRAGEITGLRWGNVQEKVVVLNHTKNGDSREVPLSPRAREILAALPRDGELVFNLQPAIRDALFRKAKARAKVENLRFHDSRAEGIWRLSRKLPVLDLARVVGHRDLRSLMIYYNTSAAQLADLL